MGDSRDPQESRPATRGDSRVPKRRYTKDRRYTERPAGMAGSNGRSGRGRTVYENGADASAYRERPRRPRPRKERRSRMAAVLIFVVVAAVIAIIGATAGASFLGGEDEGDSPPFKLLPIEAPAPTSAAPDSSVTAAGTYALETVMPARGASGRIVAVDLRADGVADASR